MYKKISPRFSLTQRKQKAVYRFLLVLENLQKLFQFRNLTTVFGHLYVLKKKFVHKMEFIETIRRRKVEQAFINLKSYLKRKPVKEKTIASLQRLSISVMAQFLCKIQKQNKSVSFLKIKYSKINIQSAKIDTFVLSMTNVLNSFQKRFFVGESMEKLKQIYINHRKMNQFNRNLNSFILKIQHSYLIQSFSLILKHAYTKMHLNNLKTKSDKMIEMKNCQLNKNQQIRLLKTQIMALTKTLQFEQVSKSKIKKEDYERNLIIQAKNTQKQKTNSELKKSKFQNQNLNYQFSKIQGYLKIRQETRTNSQSSQIIFRTVYDFLNADKTKEIMGLKQMSIFLQRSSVDLIQGLKKFEQSRQKVMMENINLKNMSSLYEKQMAGFGVLVNIKESETYKRTMEQNVNLREVLQVLFVKILQAQDKQISVNREQLSKIIESHHNSQKGSKLTLTTLSSSMNGTSY